MVEIRFYHLERSTIDTVLPRLCEKVRDMEKTIRIFVPKSHYAGVSDALWSGGSASSFAVHTIEGEKNKAHHAGVEIPEPMLHISDEWGAADVHFLWGGVSDEPILGAGDSGDVSVQASCIVCYIFDGKSDHTLQNARENWKKWRQNNDYTLSYFQQNARGGWDKKA